MKIENLKINGIREPMGYLMESIRLSCVVREAKGSFVRHVKAEVSACPDFRELLYVTEGALDTVCIPLELETVPRTRYYVRVTVTDDTGDQASGDTWFETGKQDEPWAGIWICPEKEDTFHPEFEKRFSLPRGITRARLYISGLGMYAADLNGKKVGCEVLTPYYSDYNAEVQYQTYDITDLLEAENRLVVRLADGWYKGKFGLSSRPNNWGDRFHLLAELRISWEDGRETVIATDESWRYRGSDTAESGIYDGQIIDRLLWQGRDNPWKTPEPGEVKGRVTARYSLPVVEMEELLPTLIRTPAGETVLDYGQNFAGYVEFPSPERSGARIVLDFGEILQEGNFYRDNYRSAKSQFTYVSDGRKEQVKPEFTYFGFRYVRVTGWEGEMEPADFVGKVVYSRMDRTGFLETGHEKVNRLYLNALWGQKSNFVDFPTDCPQRDERLGWCGDGQVFAGTASYNMDTAAFYHKFIHDLRTQQCRFDGILPGVIPVFGAPIFSSVWGDFATIVPRVIYEHFGDIRALEAYYPMMRDWVDKITREDIARGQRYLYDFGNQLGDWLALNGRTSQSMEGGTDEYFIGSCYYCNSVKLTADAAQALGYEADEKRYRALYARIYQAILEEYFSQSGRLCIDTQTGYLVSLYMGIYKDRETVIRGLKKRLYRDCSKLTGGFTGAPIMCRTLAENGMEEEAFYFLTQEGYPGWLNCVNLGATTIWERWNSVLQDGRISGTHMNSLNHYSYGAIVEYLYRDVAGLRCAAPGFRRVRIAPQVSVKLGHVRLRYESAWGTYRTQWEILPDGNLRVELEVPFGCTAQVELPHYPGEPLGELTAGIYEYTYQPTVEVRAKYTPGTMFKDVLGDPAAEAAIREHCPMLMYFLGSGNEDFLCETPGNLKNLGYMGFRPDQAEALEKALCQII